MKRVCIVLFTVLAMCITACIQRDTTADAEKDTAAILELYDEYRDYVNTEDLEGFMSLWTEDAIKSDPEVPLIRGMEDITRYFRYYFEKYNMEMAFVSRTQIEVDGDLAYALGQVNYSSVLFTGGDTAVIDMRWLGILKRQEDGSWKIYIDHVNFQPPFTSDSISWELFEEDNPYY